MVVVEGLEGRVLFAHPGLPLQVEPQGLQGVGLPVLLQLHEAAGEVVQEVRICLAGGVELFKITVDLPLDLLVLFILPSRQPILPLELGVTHLDLLPLSLIAPMQPLRHQ